MAPRPGAPGGAGVRSHLTPATVITTEVRPPPLQMPRPTADLARTVATWLALLALGAVLLYGRYDWSPAVHTYSKTAYVLSLYLFVLTVPTVYYVAGVLVRSRL